MFTKTLMMRGALGLLLLAGACGDDDKVSLGEQDASLPGVDGKLNDGGASVQRADGGLDIDAGFKLDGAVVPVGEEGDGGELGGDDAALGLAADGSVDNPTGLDAALVDATAALADATVFDAALADGAGPDAGSPGDCSVNDPRFGCGTAISPTWVRFDNGLEVDRASGYGWTPARTPLGPTPDVENEAYCLSLNFAGIGNAWATPEIEQVRTLAAGCDKTELGGSCPIHEMLNLPVAAGVCACDSATDAHAPGGFCRAELSSCDTLWTRTWCGPNGDTCLTYEHWFYDVTDGSISVRPYGQEPTSVKGRCFTRIPLPLP